jgi:hypothetical protein
MSTYSDSEGVPPEAAPAPAPVKKKRESVKMTDSQKKQLNKHMDKMKKDGMTGTEAKSHRMKLMSRMRNKNMSVGKAHSDIMKK